MKRKRYSSKEQLHDLALILSEGQEWRRLAIYYELTRYLILKDRKWVTETQGREWLSPRPYQRSD